MSDTYEQLKYQRDTAKSAVETWKQATANALADRDYLLATMQQLDAWFKSGVIVDGKAPEIAHSWARDALAKVRGNTN